ncbi:MAG TPA: anti-sigma factor [Acetobacteraceae bacterium]|nr:anti-sigma factor [Acetobacteraceae bacterium]
MSDAPDDLDLLAAEYVLGTLDPAQARALAERADSDAAVRDAITAGEERLAPLGRVAAPVAPPAELWQRVAASAGLRPRPVAAQPGWLARAWESLWLWRAATGMGFALAAALAAVAWLGGAPARPVAALVPQGSAAAAYVAEMRPDGRLVLVALRQIPVAQGKVLELWALPKGATRPVSLGLLPSAGQSVRQSPARSPGTQLMISLEPAGGSPTGLPTGPVLFAGTLGS